MKPIYFLSLIIFYVIMMVIVIILHLLDVIPVFDSVRGWGALIALLAGIGFMYFMGIKRVVDDMS